jgi:hypothetical protein
MARVQGETPARQRGGRVEHPGMWAFRKMGTRRTGPSSCSFQKARLPTTCAVFAMWVLSLIVDVLAAPPMCAKLLKPAGPLQQEPRPLTPPRARRGRPSAEVPEPIWNRVVSEWLDTTAAKGVGQTKVPPLDFLDVFHDGAGPNR